MRWWSESNTIISLITERKIYQKEPVHFEIFAPPIISINLKTAATGICCVDGEGEPEDRRGDRLVQGSFTVRIVKHAVEDELGLVVAGVHNRTDLDGQADGGGATIH